MSLWSPATFLVVGMLHCCSPFPVLNMLAKDADVSVKQGITYAGGPRHDLNVYSPSRGGEHAPVVVFFYGGGWETGTREMYRFVGTALAERNIVAVIPDYRLHPMVRFPAFVADAALAVAWVHDNASRFGGDPSRLFLMGHSAGAQIATLLALDETYLRAVGLTPASICGVVGLAGPYAFSPALLSHIRDIFGNLWEDAEPVSHVSAATVPMLLMAGSADGVISPESTLQLGRMLRDKGLPVETVEYLGISHRAIIATFGDPLSFLTPARPTALRFIGEQQCHPRGSGPDGTTTVPAG